MVGVWGAHGWNTAKLLHLCAAQGARGWSACVWCVGVGRHAVGLWENRPARSLGVWLLSLSTAVDCHPCVGGGGLGVWWLFVL